MYLNKPSEIGPYSQFTIEVRDIYALLNDTHVLQIKHIGMITSYIDRGIGL